MSALRRWLLMLLISASLVRCQSLAAVLVPTRNVHFLPSCVKLDEVSHHYPPTLARRLFSSVPYREWALFNVSLTWQSELVILTGASSSGKSTLLQTILRHCQNQLLQQQQPTQPSAQTTSGRVAISCLECDADVPTATTVATPVYLDQKPLFDNRRTVQAILDEICHRLDAPDYLANDLMQKVGLIDDTIIAKTPAQLTPSEQYRLELVKASLQSILCGNNITEHSNRNTNVEDCDESFLLLPAPILLLDEWLDKEPSAVVHVVQSALDRLVCRSEMGALVVVVTHKPERWKRNNNNANTRFVTLCRGKILSYLPQTPL